MYDAFLLMKELKFEDDKTAMTYMATCEIRRQMQMTEQWSEDILHRFLKASKVVDLYNTINSFHMYSKSMPCQDVDQAALFKPNRLY